MKVLRPSGFIPSIIQISYTKQIYMNTSEYNVTSSKQGTPL